MATIVCLSCCVVVKWVYHSGECGWNWNRLSMIISILFLFLLLFSISVQKKIVKLQVSTSHHGSPSFLKKKTTLFPNFLKNVRCIDDITIIQFPLSNNNNCQFLFSLPASAAKIDFPPWFTVGWSPLHLLQMLRCTVHMICKEATNTVHFILLVLLSESWCHSFSTSKNLN